MWLEHGHGKPLLSDWLGVDKVNIVPRQMHTLLIIDRLIAGLEPTWTIPVRDEVRNNLRSKDKFWSTLYEIRVCLNLREDGYDVNLLSPSGDQTIPDIAGQIGGIPVYIECKRITLQAKPHKRRARALRTLADDILPSLKRWGRCVLLEVDLAEAIDLDCVRDVVNSLTEPPTDPVSFLPGPWSMRAVAYDGDSRANPIELDDYELSFVSGSTSLTEGPLELFVVAFHDRVPVDWSNVVESRLKRALTQLPKGQCNLVFLEIADMANFGNERGAEHDLVFDAVERFLAKDTHRVSGVVVTSSGVARTSANRLVKSGPMSLRTAGTTWVFPNQLADVPLPAQFDTVRFDHPHIEIRSSPEATDQPGIKRLVIHFRE